MLALLATYLLIFYLLIPGVLFRFPTSWFLKLKLFQMNRTQEATFAVFVALLPWIAALVLVWHLPFAGSHPFGPAVSAGERSAEYRRFATLALTGDASRLFAPNQHTLDPEYWNAIAGVATHQGRFLFWYYLMTVAEGALFGVMASKYGDWRGKSSIYDFLTRKVVVPNISEWQTLLTDFTWPKKPKRSVYVDVLTREAGLYQGVMANFFLDGSGKLSGIQMDQVRRFRKSEYEAALKRRENLAHSVTEAAAPISRQDYWTAIPGTNFYIPADQILNLNIRFPFALESDLRAAVAKDLPELLEWPSAGASIPDADISIEESDD